MIKKMISGNGLKDDEFSKLDEEPIIHINKISKIPKKLTELKPKESEFEVIHESKERLQLGEITHEYLKFINSHIMIRLHQIEKTLERLEEKQLQQEKINEQKNVIPDHTDSESDVIVKEELESLIKKYGMKDLTNIINEISSKRILRKSKK